ncbi:hypothetical protein [Methylorubrum salsuginis]|uniref:Phage integrase family protein n=1 Tax=Methylorubrum salsuginis TaxID=414703 RepID=A0A1I4D2H3_9HYPH|nr:hypothetical protein [Methylorubrum salsuginis]SFK86366.1 hypothetical protein SAMN04488125_10591 [Methylorubrum salsuginis]
MLGHAGSTVTSRYVHHRDAVLIAAVDRVVERVAAVLNVARVRYGKLDRYWLPNRRRL